MKTPATPEPDWRWRHALNVTAMLPDDPADSLRILDLAGELVVTFLQPAAMEPARALVVALVRDRPDLSA